MDTDGSLLIDCDECELQATAACDDCVVTFLCADDALGAAPGAIIIDVAELRALRLLGQAGLPPRCATPAAPDEQRRGR